MMSCRKTQRRGHVGKLSGQPCEIIARESPVKGCRDALVVLLEAQQSILDLGEAVDGNEVVVHWGDNGHRIKEVRATVSKYPYLDLPRNQDYDLSTVPSGVAGG